MFKTPLAFSLTLTALALALVPAQGASAAVPHRWEARALKVATHTWHPAQPFTIVFADPTTSVAQFPDVNGRPAPVPAGGPDGWAEQDGPIYVSSTTTFLGYPDFCELVLHEGGNVVGWGHDDWSNPDSIRYPIQNVMKNIAHVKGEKRRYVSWVGVDHRCLPHHVPASSR